MSICRSYILMEKRDIWVEFNDLYSLHNILKTEDRITLRVVVTQDHVKRSFTKNLCTKT